MHQPYLSPLHPNDFERPTNIYLAPHAEDYQEPERDITYGRALWHLLLLGLTAVTTTIDLGTKVVAPFQKTISKKLMIIMHPNPSAPPSAHVNGSPRDRKSVIRTVGCDILTA